jgi:uncharacterized protein YjhX (UPF0386 family)
MENYNGNKTLAISIIVALLTLLLFSCDIMKQSAKTKSDTTVQQNEEKKSFRKGDTVHYKIPIIHYKDTTIYKVNQQGTILQTVYDKQGNVSDISCYASRIEELTKKNFELQQNIKDKASVKTEKVDNTWIFYLIAGITLIAFFAIFMIYRMVNNHTQLLTEMGKKL